MLWLLLLLYPMLAKTALAPFDCVELGGRRLLRADPAVACDDGAWLGLVALGGGLGGLQLDELVRHLDPAAAATRDP